MLFSYQKSHVKIPLLMFGNHFPYLFLQIVRMNNERFAVPEILFHPSDISIQEKGISEAIVHSISATPKGK